jgi:hypothetical protein
MRLLLPFATILSLLICSEPALGSEPIPDSNVKSFQHYSYDDIQGIFSDLQARYPRWVKLIYPEEEYLGGPSPLSCGKKSCRTVMAVLTDHDSLADNPERPQVFFSGEIHGNERVGPHAVTELAQFLLETHAQDTPKSPYFGKPNPWVSRLLTTRVTVLSPITNAYGFYHNTREEKKVDPNRDYPIDRVDHHCMETITSRVVNEVFRRYMFQLSITFHGGMQAIAYEWGTMSANGNAADRVSPDDTAQQAMGSVLSAFAGAYPRSRYPHQRINDVVYPVRGGMEDWAYAGSWMNNTGSAPCQPSNFGGYPVKQTQYTDDQLRIINVLVETSDKKAPPAEMFGDTRELLKPDGAGNGHVSRNIRLALAMSDLVEPYVQWTLAGTDANAAGDNGKEDDSTNDEESIGKPKLSPILQAFREVSCKGHVQIGAEMASGYVFPMENDQTLSFNVGAQVKSLLLSWDVGGATMVDGTQIIVGYWNETEHTHDAGLGWDATRLQRTFGATPNVLEDRQPSEMAVLTNTHMQSGPTRWSGGSEYAPDDQGVMDANEITLETNGGMDDRGEWPYQPRWSACVVLPEAVAGKNDDFFVMARARVDSEWAKMKSDVTSNPPGLAPQSHWVNARTNEGWTRSNNGHIVQGKLDWYSIPLRITRALRGVGGVVMTDRAASNDTSDDNGGADTDVGEATSEGESEGEGDSDNSEATSDGDIGEGEGESKGENDNTETTTEGGDGTDETTNSDSVGNGSDSEEGDNADETTDGGDEEESNTGDNKEEDDDSGNSETTAESDDATNGNEDDNNSESEINEGGDDNNEEGDKDSGGTTEGVDEDDNNEEGDKDSGGTTEGVDEDDNNEEGDKDSGGTTEGVDEDDNTEATTEGGDDGTNDHDNEEESLGPDESEKGGASSKDPSKDDDDDDATFASDAVAAIESTVSEPNTTPTSQGVDTLDASNARPPAGVPAKSNLSFGVYASACMGLLGMLWWKTKSWRKQNGNQYTRVKVKDDDMLPY